jgi:YggT family protein
VSYAIISLLNLVFEILTLLIFVDVIGSWILAMRVQLPDSIRRLLSLVHSITGPILEPARRLIPPIGGLDLSPFVTLIALQVLQRLLISVLIGLR